MLRRILLIICLFFSSLFNVYGVTSSRLAWAMCGLEDVVSESETDVRRYLRDDLGLPQWVSQDIGSAVGIGGKCVLAFMPGKVLSETTKAIRLLNVSFANGAGAGFKIALEEPLVKYKTVKFEKPKGTTSKGGTALEKEPKEPKLREVKAEKPKDVKPVKSEKLLWTSWREYPKETINGTEYAKIGDRLYTEHAVGRMQPSALGRNANVTKEGTNMSPTFVEHVIKNGEKTIEVEVRNGIQIERSIFKLDGCKVVAEQNGKLIITINPYSGGM